MRHLSSDVWIASAIYQKQTGKALVGVESTAI